MSQEGTPTMAELTKKERKHLKKLAKLNDNNPSTLQQQLDDIVVDPQLLSNNDNNELSEKKKKKKEKKRKREAELEAGQDGAPESALNEKKKKKKKGDNSTLGSPSLDPTLSQQQQDTSDLEVIKAAAMAAVASQNQDQMASGSGSGGMEVDLNVEGEGDEERKQRKEEKRRKKEEKRQRKEEAQKAITSPSISIPVPMEIDPDIPVASTSVLAPPNLSLSSSEAAEAAQRGEDDANQLQAMAMAAISQATEESLKKKEKKVMKKVRKEEFGNLSPQEILATKWLSGSQLKTVADDYGFTPKQGKFSTTEDEAIKASISAYALENSLSHDQINALIFFPTKDVKSAFSPRSNSKTNSTLDHQSFWVRIATSLEGRPIISVFNRVRRMYDTESSVGSWSQQEITDLKVAYRELGPKWSQIAKRVGRKPDHCKSKWVEDVGAKKGEQGGRKSGKWSKEEIENLKGGVAELGENWQSVSLKVVGRTPKQCMDKWKNSINPQMDANPWQPIHRVLLPHTIAKMNVSNLSEFEWRVVGEHEPRLAGFPAATLRKAWKRLVAIPAKEKIEGFTEQVKYLVDHIPIDSDSVPKLKTEKGEKKAKAKGKEKEKVIPAPTQQDIDIAPQASATKIKSTELVESDDDGSSSESSESESSSEESSSDDEE